MGVVRALMMCDGLSQVTHQGGNSGGNWFGSQLVFSDSFYSALTDLSRSVTDIVTEWGDSYMQAMQEAVSGAGNQPWYALEPTPCNVEVGGVNLGTAFTAPVNKLQSALGFPASNWIGYVGSMLRQTLPGIQTNTYSTTTRAGLDVTYVQTTTLPYDAYVGSNDATATLEVEFTNSETTQNFSAQNAPLLLVSFVSKSSGQEWVLPGVETMTIGGSAFELPSDPLLLEVTSGSSSAAGLFGSPTMLRNSFDLAGFDSEKVDAIMQCAPSGMQSTATPVLEPPICVEPSCSPFRYVDGAFVENTALAATVAQVQRDCAAGLADCTSATPKLILLNDGSVGTAFLGNHARLLFSSSEFPEYTTPGNYRPPSIDYPGSAPVVTIFEEEFPDDSEFTEYATFNWTMTDEEVMAFCKHLVFPFIDVVNQHKELKEEAVSSIANAVCAHKKGPAKSVCVTTAKTTISVTMSSESLVCTALQNGPAASKIGTTYTSSSVYWQGTVTTIENEFMTVTGGQQFELLLLMLQAPGIDAIIWPGAKANGEFNRVYGPMAELQAAGLEAVFQDFLG